MAFHKAVAVAKWSVVCVKTAIVWLVMLWAVVKSAGCVVSFLGICFFYDEPFKFEPLSMVVVFYFAFVYLWVVKLNSFEIVFANRFIQFIDNGVVKRQIEI